MPEILLTAENLDASPRGKPLFDGFFLELEAGDIYEVFGPNGSGKSTLLRLLAGLQRPETGTVSRNGAGVAYIGHQAGLTGTMTVAENLRWNAAMTGVRVSNSDLEYAVETLAIDNCLHTQVRELSAGQARRAALASLPLCNAQIWLLDEPLASLDEEGVDLFQQMAHECVADNRAMIYATHLSLPFEQVQTIELIPA